MWFFPPRASRPDPGGAPPTSSYMHEICCDTWWCHATTAEGVRHISRSFPHGCMKLSETELRLRSVGPNAGPERSSLTNTTNTTNIFVNNEY